MVTVCKRKRSELFNLCSLKMKQLSSWEDILVYEKVYD